MTAPRRIRVWWPIDGQSCDPIPTQRNANAVGMGVGTQPNIAGPGSNPGSGTRNGPARTRDSGGTDGQSMANPAPDLLTALSVVPWEAETWPIIEHEPEHEPVVPPDLRHPLIGRVRLPASPANTSRRRQPRADTERGGVG